MAPATAPREKGPSPRCTIAAPDRASPTGSRYAVASPPATTLAARELRVKNRTERFSNSAHEPNGRAACPQGAIGAIETSRPTHPAWFMAPRRDPRMVEAAHESARFMGAMRAKMPGWSHSDARPPEGGARSSAGSSPSPIRIFHALPAATGSKPAWLCWPRVPRQTVCRRAGRARRPCRADTRFRW
jgi:hypothetical protein